MNYAQYFANCTPIRCTYTGVDRKSVSSAVTLFISLHGGLVLILRLLAPFLIRTLFHVQKRWKSTARAASN